MTTTMITPVTTTASMIPTRGSRPRNAAHLAEPHRGRAIGRRPRQRGTYFANAAAAREEMEALVRRGERHSRPVRGGSFIVFHDAYQYFETDFDFPASGAISLGDASDPSPARIAEIRDRVARKASTACWPNRNSTKTLSRPFSTGPTPGPA
jgi:ABC-type Zn2+ transport system substrate-binding protein/surface adhesin